MKLVKNIAIIVILLALVPFTADAAQKGRKLPMGAYIKSAKIHILSGDLERYNTAIAMLDSLFMYYGPTAEAIQLRGSIEVDYIDRATTLEEKMVHVQTLVAYIDSLAICCDKDNKEVKKKYKKGCDDLVKKNDSLVVNYWRQFYNNGINFMNPNDLSTNVTSIQEDIANETDSSLIEQFNISLQAHADSSIANFDLCIALDPTDIRAYVGKRTLYDKIGDIDNAIKSLVIGIEFTDDRAPLLQTIAYDYINKNDYAGAIPYMREYVDLREDDVLTMGNLAICYNSQKMYDSAFVINQRIIVQDPKNVEALSSIGHYYRQLSKDASDSLKAAKEAGNETNTAELTALKDAYTDSFMVYYKNAIEIDPKNEQIQAIYATFNYIQSNFDLAISSFTACAEINPSKKEYWRSLGDSYIQISDFAKSAASYEEYVKIDPSDKAVWEQLVSLYGELKRPKDKANAEKQVKAL